MQKEISFGFVKCPILVFVYFEVIYINNGLCNVTEFAAIEELL